MPRKTYFTPAQANAMLPLVSRIVRDITELAHHLRDRLDELNQLAESPGELRPDEAEQLELVETEIEDGRTRMNELVSELNQLGILIKDYFIGLIDFPCWMNDHEVYLCWKQGEPEVAHWHEIDAGFRGRQRLKTEVRAN